MRKFATVAAVFSAVLLGGALAPFQYAEARQQYEGAALVAGEWHVGGQMDDAARTTVNFNVTMKADGTFVDADGYPGRWLISGSSFSMYYPDESELGYTGTISGGVIAGRFRGATVSGQFRMQRRSAAT